MVALRKESVDRNKHPEPTKQTKTVALRKESVDRNCLGAKAGSVSKWSLSARRAWIEMQQSIQLFLVLWGRSPQGERG